MNWMAQIMIAWELFKDWLKETFGTGVATGFPSPLAPSYTQGWVK